MYHKEEYDVSSQEFWPNGNIRPTTVWRYLQESASRQMSAEGPSYEQLWNKGFAFVLSRINVLFHKPIVPFEKITCRTWACDERGASFCRSYQLLNNKEEVLVEAYAIWALIDIETKKLCTVKQADLHYTNDKGLELPLPKKFHLPKELEYKEVGHKKVLYSDTDCNMHMNNTNYPDMLCNYIDGIDNEIIRSICINYINEAPLGANIKIKRAEEKKQANNYYFRTYNGDNINIEAIINTINKEM